MPAVRSSSPAAARPPVSGENSKAIGADSSASIETGPTRTNDIGMHRVVFSVDNLDEALEVAAKHGCRPLRGVATYGDA